MKLFKVSCGLLPVNGVSNWYVIAKNECIAWLYAYNIAIKSPLYDSGDIDVTRVKDFSKLANIKPIVIK